MGFCAAYSCEVYELKKTGLEEVYFRWDLHEDYSLYLDNPEQYTWKDRQESMMELSKTYPSLYFKLDISSESGTSLISEVYSRGELVAEWNVEHPSIQEMLNNYLI